MGTACAPTACGQALRVSVPRVGLGHGPDHLPHLDVPAAVVDHQGQHTLVVDQRPHRLRHGVGAAAAAAGLHAVDDGLQLRALEERRDDAEPLNEHLPPLLLGQGDRHEGLGCFGLFYGDSVRLSCSMPADQSRAVNPSAPTANLNLTESTRWIAL